MTDPRPRALVFSEARYTCDSSGVFYAEDAAATGEEWRRDIPTALAVTLVARALPTDEPIGARVAGDTVRLPYYVGPFQSAVKSFSTWLTIHRAMRNADLAIIKVPGVVGALASVSAKLRRVPVAAQVVGDARGVAVSGAAGRLLRILAFGVEYLARLTVESAKSVRYVTGRELQHRYPAGSTAQTFAFSDVSISGEPRWACPDPIRPRLVAVGSLDQLYKGHQHLLRAMVPVLSAFPDAKLTIVGSGKYLLHLRELAEDLGLAGVVDFPGFIAQPDTLRDIVARGTLFVLPSLTEGMPRALIEAMAIGVPSIASRVGGVPELLSPSETFEPADIATMSSLIIDLHHDPERLRRLSREAVRATRQYGHGAVEETAAAWRNSLTGIAHDHRKRTS